MLPGLFSTRSSVSTGGGGGATEFTSPATVANFAALPSAAANSGLYCGVLSSTGTWILGTLKPKGVYYSDGATWEYLSDYSQTDEASEINNDSTVTGTTVKDALETLDAKISSVVGSFGITIDGGGSAITTGVKGYVTIPYGMTITGWDILADQSGSIVVDVWKDTYANYPPTVADTIAGSEKPTLSTAQKNQDNTLTTWTTSVTAGDIIGFNVDSATTVTRVTLVVKGTRT